MSRVTTTTPRLIAGTIAALVLAACSNVTDDASTRSTPTEPSLGRAAEFNATRHLFRTKEFYARPGGGGTSGKGTGIYYHGGTVIAGPAVTKVVAIYWSANTIYPSQPTGTGGAASDNSLIGSFLKSLGGSPYFNINTTYTNGSGAKVLNQVTYTGFWATGSNPSSAPTDQDMINLIDNGLKSGAIAYDPNTVYAIFTGNGVNLGGGFGSQYCAYHTHGTTSKGLVYYAAMPYNQQYPSACTSALASPNTDVAGNSEVNTLAHEIEETTTDAMGNAWYDNRGYENADKCAWTWGTIQTASNGGKYNMKLADGKYYLVQQNWVNAGSGGCAVSY
jgi:Phosphate-induced protein 1 conserved region